MNCRKIMALVLAVMMLALAVSSCTGKTEETTATTTSETTGSTDSTEVTTAATEETTSTTATETETETTTTAAATTTERTQYAVINDGDFDEKNIVISFGAVSDTHQTGSNDAYSAKLKSAFRQLKEMSEKTGKTLDAVTIAGDLTDNGSDSQIRQVKTNYESVFDPLVTPMIYCMGNHDAGTSTASTIARFVELLGNNYFQTDLSADTIKSGSRHCEVNGIHFVCVIPETYGSYGEAAFSAETVKWLDDTLSSISKDNPGEPIFVLVHAMIYDTCYGSTLKTGYAETSLGWYTKDLTETLSKYSQVITLSGHLHFPLNDERSIMQTTFTSVGCGSVRYMAIEAGNYQKMSGSTVMADHDQFSQGLLIQVDASGNTRIIRMDFYNEDTIKTAWVVPSPKADGSHLSVYGKDRADNPAPAFPADTEITVNVISASSTTIYPSLTFTAANDDDLIHDYRVTMYNVDADIAIRTFNILADFYLVPTPDGMKTRITQQLNGMKDGVTYKITIEAFDSWGNSCQVSKTVKADLANSAVIVLD